MNKKTNPEKIDDDTPEWTQVDVQRAVAFSGLPKGLQTKLRGRPRAATTKEPVKIRLDADILLALRASGEGWQTRINDTLRASLQLAGSLSA